MGDELSIQTWIHCLTAVFEWNVFPLIKFYISSVLIHTVPLTWCFLGSGDISCGMNLIGPLICLLDLFVPSGSVSMAISASSLLAWSHSEHCLRRRNKAPLNELYWFHDHRPTCLVSTVKKNKKTFTASSDQKVKNTRMCHLDRAAWKNENQYTNMFGFFLIKNCFSKL